MTAWGGLRNLVTLAGGVGTLLAILGYVGLRTHFNMLGVPLSESLGTERYLTETLAFAVGLLVRLVVIVAVVTTFGGMVLLVGSRSHSLLTRTSSLLSTWSSRPVFLWLGSMVTVVLLLFCLGVISKRQDLVVGTLELERIAWRHYHLFELALVATIIVVAAALNASRRITISAAEPLAVLSSAALSLTAPAWIITVAALFGQEIRPSLYSWVSVHPGEGKPPVCGLLVLATKNALQVWHVELSGGQSRGLVTSLQVSGGTIVEFGRVGDILELTEKAAVNRTSMTCPV